MSKIIKLLISTIIVPIFFFKDNRFGRTLKEKFKFFNFFLINSNIFKLKKRIRLGDIKVVKYDFLGTNNIEDLKINFITSPNTNNISWSEEQKKMRENILKGNYKEGFNNDNIEISKDNIVIDGNHRISALKEIYNEDYKILVFKNFVIKWGNHARNNLLILWNWVSKDENKDVKVLEKSFKKTLMKFQTLQRSKTDGTESTDSFDTDGYGIDDLLGVNSDNNNNNNLTIEMCYLLLKVWNNTFPKNKIEVDE